MMAIATATVAELVSQMQANLDAINYHLDRISDTKAHDDEIERLELEREKRAELLSLQWEMEARELEEKKRQAALPAIEQRRREVAAKRAQEAEILAAARKREDEEIAARRRKEDDERQAKIQQHENELKAIAQREEEEIALLFAAEEEKRRSDAVERENTLFDEFEDQMERLEDEMEKKVEESQHELAELEQKRQSISAMIEAKMRAPRPTSFRRGSKRFSSSPLAADVETMLASGKPPLLQRKSTLSRITEPSPISRGISAQVPAQAHLATLDALTKPVHNSPKQVLDQATLPIIRGSHGALNFRGEGAEMMAVESPQVRQLPKSSEAPAQNVHKHSLLPTWADQSKLDIVAGDWGMLVFRDEGADMETIRTCKDNVPLIEATEYSPTSTGPDQPLRQRATSSATPEKVWFAAPKPIQIHRGHLYNNTRSPPPHIISHKRKPSRTSPHMSPKIANGLGSATMNHGSSITSPRISNGLGSATMNHGASHTTSPSTSPKNIANGLESATMNHGFERSIRRSVRSNENIAIPKDVVVIGGGEVYDVHHPVLKELARATKWKCMGNVCWEVKEDDEPVTVRGSHAMLAFSDHDAVTKVVKSNPYWRDQATLPVVRGDYGMLIFSDDEAEMKAVRSNPYWRDQATLTMVRGAHGILHFTGAEAMTKVVKPNPYWRDQSTLSTIRGQHAMLDFSGDEASAKIVRPDLYWRDQATLQIVKGAHGKLIFDDGASVKGMRPNPYWGDQSTLHTLTGQHGKLHFTSSGAITKTITPKIYWEAQLALAISQAGRGKRASGRSAQSPKQTRSKSVDINQYWVDQSTLSTVRGDHGRLAFGEAGAALDIFKHDAYWANQSNLSTVRGSHGKLAFGARGAATEVVRANPYWSKDQKTLAVVKGSHGKLEFDDVDASLVIIKTNPYWSQDQASLSEVRGLNGKLAFTSSGASMEAVRPDPYWVVNQALLSEVRGRNGKLAFDSNGAEVEIVRPDPYWVADQSLVSEVRGSNGKLAFNVDGAALQIVRPNPYWTADQKDLVELKGSYGQLTFGISGSSMVIKRPDPYWTANQRELPRVWGTHAELSFDLSGASMNIKRPDPYWTANQNYLATVRGSNGCLTFDSKGAATKISKADAYWDADQSKLHERTGKHGMLSFHETEASLELMMESRPYWTADQANLDTIQGSHGTMDFHPSAALTTAIPHSTPKRIDHIAASCLAHLSTPQPPSRIPSPKGSIQRVHTPTYTPPNLPTYWTDQSQLPTLSGKHGTLVFSNSGAATVPYSIDPKGFASPLETGDFFGDSDDHSDYEDFRPSRSQDQQQNQNRISLSKFPDPPASAQRPEFKPRKSFGPGAIAALLGKVRDNVPIVTNLVGDGSYSSLLEHEHEHENENDSSPVTPTSPTPLNMNPAHTNQVVGEPMIHQEHSHPHPDDLDFGNFESHRQQEVEELNKAASPLPTQTEFDGFLNNLGAGGIGRTVTGSWEKRQSREVIPIRSMSGSRPRNTNRDSLISRTRAMFEGPN